MEQKEAESDSVCWYPQSINDLHKCCTSLYRFGNDHGLSPDHPGFGDTVYEERRKDIADLAITYKYGEPIPKVKYTAEEIKIWRMILQNQLSLFQTHACKAYNTCYPGLFETCGYREDNIPQLEDVSQYLRTKTNWQLWPVIGWISPRDFLASLAFRCFPTSQYIRHGSSPFYTPEPDICHELIGHMPLLCDPSFADFSQEIGLASLGASEEMVKKLATLYWFTVEFGLCKENGQVRAYGAGLLSSGDELQYAITDKPEHKDFSVERAMTTDFPETGFQPLYFIVESLESLQTQMRDFITSLSRPFLLIYDAQCQCVKKH